MGSHYSRHLCGAGDCRVSQGSKFQEIVAQRRAQQEAAAAAAARDADLYADVIPERDTSSRESDTGLDAVLDRLSIVDAYRQFCGKMTPSVRPGQTESIMVSCPVPGHVDRNPSAWLNSAKNTWYCASCEQGGDSYDIAAFYFGMNVPNYKTDGSFPELRKSMAAKLGYVVHTPVGTNHSVVYQTEALLPPPPPAPVTPVTPIRPLALVPPVTEETDADPVQAYSEEDIEEIIFPTLDWQKLIDPGTFLEKYMETATQDDVPEEYHFWNGLLCLGAAVGRQVSLSDTKPVLGNLFICLLGYTGDGKSRSYSYAKDLLHMALPYNDSAGIISKGVRLTGAPGSGEALVNMFSRPVFDDPANPKLLTGYAPVRGMVEFAELSQLTGRGARVGSVLKPTLHEFYDNSPLISVTSMTHGVNKAEEPFANLFTTSQPESLREILGSNDADSGFINRFVFASGKTKTRIPIGGLRIDMTPVVPYLERVHAWPGTAQKVITWSADAFMKMSDFLRDVIYPIQKSDRSGFLSRIDLLYKKLALLFTVNLMEDEVSAETIEKVMSMHDYLIAAYAIPQSRIGDSKINEIHDELARHIQHLTAANTPPTIRELGMRVKRKKYAVDLIHKVLKIMGEMGEVEVVQDASKRGRPSTRYKWIS